MPVVIIRVVWYFVVVDVLTLSENSLHLYELPGVYFSWPTCLILEGSWNPSSVDDDCGSLDFDWVTSTPEFLHRYFTSFIAVKRVDDLIPVNAILSLWEQYLLGVIKLTKNIVRLESVVDIEFFIRHSPPGEVKLLPRSDVLSDVGESIVSLRSQEFLSNLLSVIEVGDTSCEKASHKSSVANEGSLLLIHPFDKALG